MSHVSTSNRKKFIYKSGTQSVNLEELSTFIFKNTAKAQPLQTGIKSQILKKNPNLLDLLLGANSKLRRWILLVQINFYI
jgi:hypothetical protein